MSDIRDVASLARVSPGTVSNAFNNPEKVSQETLERVQKAAAELNYCPNRLARSLISTKTHMLGIMVASIYNEAYSNGVKAIFEHVKPMGYSMLLYNTDFQLAEEMAGIQQFLEYRVDGVIIMSHPGIKETGHLDVLAEKQIPVVLIARDSTQFDQVDMDFRHAVVELLKYIRGLGHERLGLITGPLYYADGKPSGRWERLNTAISCMNEYGMPFSIEHMREGKGEGFEDGYSILCRWCESGEPLPSCLFVLSDDMAMGAMAALEEYGLRLPQDISIVGFSNVNYTRFPHISLTTISREYEQAGRIAAALLTNRLFDPAIPRQHEVVKNRLVVRNSCGEAGAPFVYPKAKPRKAISTIFSG